MVIVALSALGDIGRIDFRDADPFEAGLRLAPSYEITGSTRQDTDDRERFERALWGAVERIDQLVSVGNLKEAKRQIDISLERYPSNPILVEMAARIHARMNDWERASSYWLDLVELYPEDINILAAAGSVLMRIHELEKAENILQRALERNPYHTPTILQLISLHVTAGRDEEAASLLTTMTVADLGFIARRLHEDYDVLVPTLGAKGYTRLGQLVLSGGRVSPNDLPSGAALESAVEEREARRATADMRQRLRRTAEFVERFDRVVQAEEWARAARLGVGQEGARIGLTAPVFNALVLYVRHRAGDDAALVELSVLRANEPEALFAHIYFGVLLMEIARYEDAEPALRAAKSLQPGHALTAVLLACVLAERGYSDQALTKLAMLDETVRPFVRRWFDAEAVYQQAILNDEIFAAWRSAYLNRY